MGTQRSGSQMSIKYKEGKAGWSETSKQHPNGSNALYRSSARTVKY